MLVRVRGKFFPVDVMEVAHGRIFVCKVRIHSDLADSLLLEIGENEDDFDGDHLDFHVHQAEGASADDYVFRRFADSDEERGSVKFFFDVRRDLAEFTMLGFSKNCYEAVGGIPRASRMGGWRRKTVVLTPITFVEIQ